MSRFKFSKKLGNAIAISIAVGLVLGLSSSVSALRRIDNRVDINAPTIPLGESGTSSASSGDYAFEKGDAIYRPFDVSAFMKLPLKPADKILLFLWSRVGHAGLYWYWQPDKKNDPTIKENHKTIESNLARPHPLLEPFKGAGVHDNYDFQYFVDSGGCWGVRTSQRLDDNIRRRIIAAATKQLGRSYHFFWGYKRPGVSFRCDGLVEYCYEVAFGDEWKPGKNGGIVKNDFWRPRRGCRVLYPRRQFNSLSSQDNAFFPTLIFGKLEGEVMHGPIWIEGVEIPLKDGKYEVYGDEVEVNVHASDIDWDSDGSGITRLELWVGEVDDTPGEMPGLRLLRDDTNYPAGNDYTYIWDTAKKEDGEPLFPNGEYTLKAIGFDQAGNKAENEIQVEVANAEKYLYVRVEPCYVETDKSNDDRTDAFNVYVEVWDFGKCLEEGCSPEGCVQKKEETQGWYYDEEDGRYRQEVCCENYEVEPIRDTEMSGTVVLSPLHPDVDPDSESSGLWKAGWDGAITITDGVGSVNNVRYRDKDGNSISGRHMVFLVEASIGGTKGNDLLMINPIFLKPSGDYEYQFRATTGQWDSSRWTGSGYIHNYDVSWSKLLEQWQAESYGSWGSEPYIMAWGRLIRTNYLVCHLFQSHIGPQHTQHKRWLGTQRYRVPYHAIHPDTGEILTNVVSAIAISKFWDVVPTGPWYDSIALQRYRSPAVKCATTGVTNVITQSWDEEHGEYIFGDVGELFNGNEFIKVEYHPVTDVVPNLFPNYDWDFHPKAVWVRRTRLQFESKHPQIIVIP